MVVKGTIQSGPLMEHTSYSGGDKVARVTATRSQGGCRQTGTYIAPTSEWQSENHFSFRQE